RRSRRPRRERNYAAGPAARSPAHLVLAPNSSVDREVLVPEQRGRKGSEGASEGGEDNPLRDYLVKLATDPAELGRVVKDLEAAGVSAEDRAVLKSGNPSAIYARLAGAGASFGGAPVAVLVVDMEAAAEGAEQTPTVRGSALTLTLGGGQTMYPQAPQQLQL